MKLTQKIDFVTGRHFRENSRIIKSKHLKTTTTHSHVLGGSVLLLHPLGQFVLAHHPPDVHVDLVVDVVTHGHFLFLQGVTAVGHTAGLGRKEKNKFKYTVCFIGFEQSHYLS